MRVGTQTAITALLLVNGCVHASEQESATGFIEDSSLKLLNRNFYFNRDFRDASPGSQSYREEWAQGLLGFYRSGFTQGVIGLGVDAHVFAGVRLDGGPGRSKGKLLPVDSDGRPADGYSTGGAALKARISSTTLRYGELQPNAPVFATADSRLFPETATGFLLESHEVQGLNVQAGHFTAFKRREASGHDGDLLLYYGDGKVGSSIDFVGGDYALGKQLTLSLYASQFDDTWNQYYGGIKYLLPLSASSSFAVQANAYRTRDTGAAYQGRIDTTAYSIATTYTHGAHRFTLGYQKINGDTPFDYVGTGSIFLDNASNYSDFNGAHEASYQARYDLNLAALKLPGVTFSVRYVTGAGIDGTGADIDGGYVGQQGRGGKHWERDLDLKYVVQSGAAKDLSLRLRQATHRANASQGESDIDEVRLIAEYPLSIF